MKKKRILLISDVKGWGGWVRGQYIKKYLKYDYDIHLMDSEEFRKWEMKVNSNCFTHQDFKDFKPHGDKNFYNFDKFRNFVLNREKKPWDLYYFLFHTMLMKKSVKRLADNNNAIMTIVTVFPTLRNIFYGSFRGNRQAALQRFRKMANKCKAISANNYKSLEDLKDIYNGPTFYMPRGVDSEIFFPMTTTFEKKEESDFTVAFCGKPNPEKGLQNIIRPACSEANVKLITNERNFTDALSESDMRDFYNKADVYIVASTMDGTPNTALEAASCGKPIIANAIGNMPEFIKDGVNGFLVPLEIKKYVQKLKWMKTNQKKTWEMGREARETVLREWTWKKVINNNERKIFRELLNG